MSLERFLKLRLLSCYAVTCPSNRLVPPSPPVSAATSLPYMLSITPLDHQAKLWTNSGNFGRVRRSLLQSPVVVPGAAAIGIVGQAPATCWDSSNGANVVSANCTGSATQLWDMTSAGGSLRGLSWCTKCGFCLMQHTDTAGMHPCVGTKLWHQHHLQQSLSQWQS